MSFGFGYGFGAKKRFIKPSQAFFSHSFVKRATTYVGAENIPTLNFDYHFTNLIGENHIVCLLITEGGSGINDHKSICNTVGVGGRRDGSFPVTATLLKDSTNNKWTPTGRYGYSAFEFATEPLLLPISVHKELSPEPEFELNLDRNLALGGFDFVWDTPDNEHVEILGYDIQQYGGPILRNGATRGYNRLRGTADAYRAFTDTQQDGILFSHIDDATGSAFRTNRGFSFHLVYKWGDVMFREILDINGGSVAP